MSRPPVDKLEGPLAPRFVDVRVLAEGLEALGLPPDDRRGELALGKLAALVEDRVRLRARELGEAYLDLAAYYSIGLEQQALESVAGDRTREELIRELRLVGGALRAFGNYRGDPLFSAYRGLRARARRSTPKGLDR